MATSSKSLTGKRRRGADAPIAPPREASAQPVVRHRVIEFRDVSKLYAGDVGLDHVTFSVICALEPKPNLEWNMRGLVRV